MTQAFIIVLREGVEAFLIVAITLAYLRKTQQHQLVHAVFWGIAGSFVVSGLLGYFLWINQGAQQPLIEGVLALVTAILVLTLIVHMWRIGPTMKQEMETKLHKISTEKTKQGSLIGIFLFTLLMVSREGMETALLLFQIHEPQIVTGVVLGIIAAGLVALLWQQFGYLINMKHFFQVTALFLTLFTIQIFVQAFHEFTEAGIFPNSDMLHKASEPFSTEGIYGKMFANITFSVCGLWLIGNWVLERLTKSKAASLGVDSRG